MASCSQVVKMVAMGTILAILLIAIVEADPQPEEQCSCSVECACAEKCTREYSRIDDDPPFKISPVCTHVQKMEFYAKLYMHHTTSGSGQNQEGVLKPGLGKNNFGSMVVNDWTITEESSADSKLVARAVGLHVQAGFNASNYYVSFNLVFLNGRFAGSTLQVMGIVVEDHDWAIVGGTGELTLARGVIYKDPSKFQSESGGNSAELEIRAFYTPLGSL